MEPHPQANPVPGLRVARSVRTVRRLSGGGGFFTLEISWSTGWTNVANGIQLMFFGAVLVVKFGEGFNIFWIINFWNTWIASGNIFVVLYYFALFKFDHIILCSDILAVATFRWDEIDRLDTWIILPGLWFIIGGLLETFKTMLLVAGIASILIFASWMVGIVWGGGSKYVEITERDTERWHHDYLILFQELDFRCCLCFYCLVQQAWSVKMAQIWVNYGKIMQNHTASYSGVV